MKRYLLGPLGSGRLLEYEVGEGPLREINLHEAPSKNDPINGVARYINFEGKLVGALEELTETIVFVDGYRVPLADPELSINLQENNGRRAIEILHKGKTLVVGQYPIPEIAEWDVYSDDTSEDFFYWLTKTKNQNQ